MVETSSWSAAEVRGNPERLPRMLEELVASKVDVIYAGCLPRAPAAVAGEHLVARRLFVRGLEKTRQDEPANGIRV